MHGLKIKIGMELSDLKVSMLFILSDKLQYYKKWIRKGYMTVLG